MKYYFKVVKAEVNLYSYLPYNTGKTNDNSPIRTKCFDSNII